jgi:hypothetical protein
MDRHYGNGGGEGTESDLEEQVIAKPVVSPALTLLQRLDRHYLHALRIGDPTLCCGGVRASLGAHQAEDAHQRASRHGKCRPRRGTSICEVEAARPAWSLVRWVWFGRVYPNRRDGKITGAINIRSHRIMAERIKDIEGATRGLTPEESKRGYSPAPAPQPSRWRLHGLLDDSDSDLLGNRKPAQVPGG